MTNDNEIPSQIRWHVENIEKQLSSIQSCLASISSSRTAINGTMKDCDAQAVHFGRFETTIQRAKGALATFAGEDVPAIDKPGHLGENREGVKTALVDRGKYDLKQYYRGDMPWEVCHQEMTHIILLLNDKRSKLRLHKEHVKASHVGDDA